MSLRTVVSRLSSPLLSTFAFLSPYSILERGGEVLVRGLNEGDRVGSSTAMWERVLL